MWSCFVLFFKNRNSNGSPIYYLLIKCSTSLNTTILRLLHLLTIISTCVADLIWSLILCYSTCVMTHHMIGRTTWAWMYIWRIKTELLFEKHYEFHVFLEFFLKPTNYFSYLRNRTVVLIRLVHWSNCSFQNLNPIFNLGNPIKLI